MRFFLALSAFFVLLYAVGFIADKQKVPAWMGKDHTTALKGFAILTVVWGHIGDRLGVGGIQFIAGVGVVLFLLCSGYGLEYSCTHRGLAGYWKRRIVKVCIPFWIVECIGLLATGKFTVQKFLGNALFVNATWFLRYIMICYVIYYITKLLVDKLSLSMRIEMTLLFSFFAIWFLLESLFFANPDMPFLEARQMLSFPMGVLLAKNKDQFTNIFSNKKRCLVVLTTALVTGLAFMAITQLAFIKQLPYLLSNILALFTVFPLAIAVLLLGKLLPILFNNRFLEYCGVVSYELFLIHLFTTPMIETTWLSITTFLCLTVVLVIALHLLILGGTKLGRLNSSHSNKE